MMFVLAIALLAAPLNAQMVDPGAMGHMDNMHMDMSGQMGSMHMGHMDDMNSHHRCCQHDMWYGTMYMSEAYVVNNTAVGKAFYGMQKSMIMIDYNYDMMMERLQIHSHDVIHMTNTSLVQYKDYKNMMEYSMMDGKCTVKHSDEKMSTPCIPDDFMYGGHIHIGSGNNTIKAHNWHGMMNGMEMSMSVTESDCTPVSMNVRGDIDGTKFNSGYLFADVHQGMVSSTDAFDLPMECKMASVPTSSVGK